MSAPAPRSQPDSEHTPTPWHVGGIFDPNSANPKQNVWGKTPDGMQSGEIVVQLTSPANAAFIVEAVNSHAALQESCEELGDMVKARDAQLFVAEQEAAALKSRVEELTRERDEARLLVTEANNSLYGSQGYFHSLNGGPFDKYHLANGIENLKAICRRASAISLEDRKC